MYSNYSIVFCKDSCLSVLSNNFGNIHLFRIFFCVYVQITVFFREYIFFLIKKYIVKREIKICHDDDGKMLCNFLLNVGQTQREKRCLFEHAMLFSPFS
jgi:hypothetical protein